MTEPKHLNAGSSGEWGWHATELAMRCPQLFAYHHRIKDAALEGSRGALLRGSMVHQGLGHHYARMQNAQNGLDPNEWAKPDAAIIACADALCHEDGTNEAMKYLESSRNIVADYIAHYGGEKLDVVAVEEIFSAEIAGYKFTQRLDLVARRENGKVYIFDHKTTGRISEKSSERYTLSGQFLGMATFGRSLWGTDFGGVIINLIGCGPVDSYSAPGATAFKRAELDPAPEALRLFPLTIRDSRDRIAALDASGRDPWEWPKVFSEQVCVGPYGRCDGFNLCRWGS
jgi:hypothetical protein